MEIPYGLVSSKLEDYASTDPNMFPLKVPVQGSYLSNIFVKLTKYPGMTLVQIGEPASKDEEPVYVARGWHRVCPSIFAVTLTNILVG
jgi:hypothetical protein